VILAALATAPRRKDNTAFGKDKVEAPAPDEGEKVCEFTTRLPASSWH